jgi:hypothetical protein
VEEVTVMPKTVEIRMTLGGFEVAVGGRIEKFSCLEDAVAFAHDRLGRAQQLRELSALID